MKSLSRRFGSLGAAVVEFLASRPAHGNCYIVMLVRESPQRCLDSVDSESIRRDILSYLIAFHMFLSCLR